MYLTDNHDVYKFEVTRLVSRDEGGSPAQESGRPPVYEGEYSRNRYPNPPVPQRNNVREISSKCNRNFAERTQRPADEEEEKVKEINDDLTPEVGAATDGPKAESKKMAEPIPVVSFISSISGAE